MKQPQPEFVVKELQHQFSEGMEIAINHRVTALWKERTKSSSKMTTEQFKDFVMAVHQEIKDCVFEIFSKCKFTLDGMSKKYVAQEFFKMMKINGDQDFMHAFAINEIKVSELNVGDVRLLEKLFHDTEIGDAAEKELARRG